MIKLKYTDYFDYPVDLVFKIFRDRLEEYPKYCSNLVSVKVKERKELDAHRVLTKAEWRGAGHIPLVVRAILRPEMIKWKDECIWDEKKYRWDWKIEPFYFKEFVKCSGSWKLTKEGKDKTKIELDGIFSVYIPHFPGVPDRVAQGAGGIIEKFIMRYLEPNLKENNKTVRKILEKEYSKKKR